MQDKHPSSPPDAHVSQVEWHGRQCDPSKYSAVNFKNFHIIETFFLKNFKRKKVLGEGAKKNQKKKNLP